VFGDLRGRGTVVSPVSTLRLKITKTQPKKAVHNPTRLPQSGHFGRPNFLRDFPGLAELAPASQTFR